MVNRSVFRPAAHGSAGMAWPIRLAACFLALTATAAPVWAQPAYKVVAVPVYTDPFNTTVHTYSTAVNRGGQVSAVLYQELGGTAAHRCTRAACTNIPPLGDAHHGGPSANDINDAGLVVGTSPYEFMARGYLFDGVASSNLGAFSEGICQGCNLSSYARGINNLGDVVGEGETADGDYRAFVWSNGTMRKLGTLGGNMSAAYAINDRGVVVGHASLPGGAWHAFAQRNGRMWDLGTLGGTHSWAYDVNNSGQVVGCSGLPGGTQTAAFVYRDSAMAALPGLGGTFACATGINAVGWVVGYAELASGAMTGFLHDGTTLVDLNDTLSPADRAAWRITEANGINKKGQIAAVGVSLAHGSTRALLLTPRSSTPATR
jgi:probable HAF family extracellular repeat protein